MWGICPLAPYQAPSATRDISRAIAKQKKKGGNKGFFFPALRSCSSGTVVSYRTPRLAIPQDLGQRIMVITKWVSSWSLEQRYIFLD